MDNSHKVLGYIYLIDYTRTHEPSSHHFHSHVSKAIKDKEILHILYKAYYAILVYCHVYCHIYLHGRFRKRITFIEHIHIHMLSL